MVVALAFTRLALANPPLPLHDSSTPRPGPSFPVGMCAPFHIMILRLDADTTESAAQTLDGTEIPRPMLPLRDDRKEHSVEMTIR